MQNQPRKCVSPVASILDLKFFVGFGALEGALGKGGGCPRCCKEALTKTLVQSIQKISFQDGKVICMANSKYLPNCVINYNHEEGYNISSLTG